MNNTNTINGTNEAAGHVGYHPEMGEAKPAAQIEAALAHYGNHYFLKTPLVLKGRGVTHINTLTSGQLTPAAQSKVGWHEYKVTMAAFEKLSAQYRIVSEILL